MKTLSFITLLLISLSGIADTLKSSDLVGEWVPSGEFPATKDLVEYEFQVLPSGDGIYKSIGKNSYSLDCKAITDRASVFVYECYSKDSEPVITLSLSGWSSKQTSGSSNTSARPEKLLYGFEYWLHPGMGGVYGGVPVSLKPKIHITSKGSG
ncbi:hypothetical protein ACVBEJ_14555 [Porticoccus sp. GXU_MW_L64]